jgi:hypothetical protein
MSTDDITILKTQLTQIVGQVSPDPDQRVYDLEEALRLARKLQQLERQPPPDPSSLARSDVATVVRHIQQILWLDIDDDGNDAWNADKEWSADTIEDVASVLIKAGLRPSGRL